MCMLFYVIYMTIVLAILDQKGYIWCLYIALRDLSLANTRERANTCLVLLGTPFSPDWIDNLIFVQHIARSLNIKCECVILFPVCTSLPSSFVDYSIFISAQRSEQKSSYTYTYTWERINASNWWKRDSIRTKVCIVKFTAPAHNAMECVYVCVCLKKGMQQWQLTFHIYTLHTCA